MKYIELLSPAKDVDTAIDAILCGADSVYIGSPEFSARTNASNSIEDIARLCDFAHLYSVKVCVALNTILNNREIEKAVDIIHKLYKANVDAIIVQDLGLLECELPPIAIHASTQCHTTTPSKAKFLEDAGFNTIVVARELSIDEIKDIADVLKPDTAIECFIHGALCVSYSGQCNLSYAIGGRSGNRGECAQPCRMKYELLDADGKIIAQPAHFLSLKDMNRTQNIGDMLDSGVNVFKIEGRLKDSNYVKNITSLYRNILDKHLTNNNASKLSFGKTYIKFQPDANKSFNRSFTKYHINGTQKNCSAFETPKAKGEFIDTITDSFDGGFYLKNAKDIFANNDGLLFEYKNKTFGTAIRKVDNDKVYLGRPDERIKIPRGCKIFRNRDVKFEAQLEQKISRKMSVEIVVENINDSNIRFSIKTLDRRNILVSEEISNFEIANNKDFAKQKLIENLSKLGNTEFESESVIINTVDIPLLKAAQVNEIRRNLVEKLSAEIIKIYNTKLKSFQPNKPILNTNIDDIPNDAYANVLNSYAKKFYERRNIDIVEPAFESECVDIKNRRVMTTKHCILRELNMCKKSSKVRFKEPLILRNSGSKLDVVCDCKRCGMDIYYKNPKKLVQAK